MKAAGLVVTCLACLGLGACTTLGPMAATTAISSIPAGRPGVELQAGVVPGYMLSDATRDPRGTPLGQLSALIEPDRWLGLPGLIVGARQVGSDDDTMFEPFVGYRRQLDDHIAVAGVGYGTRATGDAGKANYAATRVGAELGVDARIASIGWLGLHLQASVSGTVLDARGQYCVAPDGMGTDCNGDATDHLVDATVAGVYANATTGVSLDLQQARGVLHAVRFAMLLTVGSMPELRDGEQQRGNAFVSAGATLAVGFGE